MAQFNSLGQFVHNLLVNYRTILDEQLFLEVVALHMESGDFVPIIEKQTETLHDSKKEFDEVVLVEHLYAQHYFVLMKSSIIYFLDILLYQYGQMLLLVHELSHLFGLVSVIFVLAGKTILVIIHRILLLIIPNNCILHITIYLLHQSPASLLQKYD